MHMTNMKWIGTSLDQISIRIKHVNHSKILEDRVRIG